MGAENCAEIFAPAAIPSIHRVDFTSCIRY